MKGFTRFYASIVIAVVVLCLFHIAHAVEITPDIGFKHSYSGNKTQDDRNSSNPEKEQSINQALNDKYLHDHFVTKAIPAVNSVGLNFTFKVD